MIIRRKKLPSLQRSHQGSSAATSIRATVSAIIVTSMVSLRFGNMRCGIYELITEPNKYTAVRNSPFSYHFILFYINLILTQLFSRKRKKKTNFTYIEKEYDVGIDLGGKTDN